MKTVKTQIATSFSSDFEDSTWTFLMPEGFNVWAGQFAIIDKPVYEELLEALKGLIERGEIMSDTTHLKELIKKATT